MESAFQKWPNGAHPKNATSLEKKEFQSLKEIRPQFEVFQFYGALIYRAPIFSVAVQH